MHEYDEAVLRCFLENQGQLFPEDVAENMEEAEAFLEDSMAVVVDSPEEVEEYFEEEEYNIKICKILQVKKIFHQRRWMPLRSSRKPVIIFV